jgi:hypothetical protein
MTCPNRAGKSCTLLAGITVTDFGCSLCRQQWGQSPPAADSLTPFLVELKTGSPPAGESLPRGLGDTVARVLERLGIRKRRGCGCGKRRAWLNRLVPYRS